MIQLSFDAMLIESWHLMKGSKVRIWKRLIPIMFGLVIFVLSALPLIILNAQKNQNTTWIVLSLILAGFGFLIFWVQAVVSIIALRQVGYETAQNQDDGSWYMKALKRVAPFFIACIVIVVVAVPWRVIPGFGRVLGLIINFFVGPYVLAYQFLVILDKGPFSSIPRTFKVIHKNYWRALIAIFVLNMLSLFLGLTVIGLIWAIPFRAIGYGIIYRDVIEPKLKEVKAA